MVRRMKLEQFVEQGRAAQGAVDAILEEHSPKAEGAPAVVDAEVEEPGPPPAPVHVGEEFRYLAVDEIAPSPFQPRDRARIVGPKFEELVASAKVGGIRIPITVRPMKESASVYPWELVTGERRLLAAREAALPSIPAIIRTLTDVQVMEEQMIENLQRDDLDPIEEARGFQRLLEVRPDGRRPLYTQTSLAKRLGISQEHIANRLRLLALPENVQQQVATSAQVAEAKDERPLSPSHAQILVPFASYPWILEAINGRIKEEGLPPAKEFLEFVQEVVFGRYTKSTMLIRPMQKGQFYMGTVTMEFPPESKSLPRNWSQLPQYQTPKEIKGGGGFDPLSPGPGPCTDCPHQHVFRTDRYGQSRERKWCMLSACWDGKQQTHRTLTKQRAKETVATKVKRDPGKLDRRTLKHGEFIDLIVPPGQGYRETTPLFDLTICKTKCPFKVDNLPAFRQTYYLQGGKYQSAGAVCLRPAHFSELQNQAAAKKVQAWRDGTVSELKGLVKQAHRGLTGEDLARLILWLLDGDLECTPVLRALAHRERPKVKGQIAMTEFFRLAHGLKESALEVKRLAGADRKELERYLKFALEFHRKHARGRR